jgi:hypothetical protein
MSAIATQGHKNAPRSISHRTEKWLQSTVYSVGNITATKTNLILGRRSTHSTKCECTVSSTGTDRRLELVGISVFTCFFFLLLLLVQLSTLALLLYLLRTTLLRTFSGLARLQVTHGGCICTVPFAPLPLTLGSPLVRDIPFGDILRRIVLPVPNENSVMVPEFFNQAVWRT